jgi:hypothetical protein
MYTIVECNKITIKNDKLIDNKIDKLIVKIDYKDLNFIISIH